MKKIDRGMLRGKRLNRDCYRARVATHEYPDDNRVFCYGLIDDRTDEPLEMCRECGAFVRNSTPLVKKETK